jgi:hypothetical protein
VKPYNGTKALVISTVSWIGGKNPFLGWAYIAAAALFFLLGILGTIRHLVKPRFAAALSPWEVLLNQSLDNSATCRFYHGTVDAHLGCLYFWLHFATYLYIHITRVKVFADALTWVYCHSSTEYNARGTQ